MTRQALVIGYGNTLRGDDAVGQVVARALAGEAAIEGVEVIACHQLMPELAECIDAADLVVFIDAAADLQPGAIVAEVVQAASLSSGLVHHVDPRMLLFMTAKLYGLYSGRIRCQSWRRLVRAGRGTVRRRRRRAAGCGRDVRQLVLEQPGTQARTKSSMVPSASSN